jgi:excisionase family DNA binding protein
VLPTFLTADELAVVLRCQPEKVYRLAARHELPSYKVEGRRLFKEAEVNAPGHAQRNGSVGPTPSCTGPAGAAVEGAATISAPR